MSESFTDPRWNEATFTPADKTLPWSAELEKKLKDD